MSHGEPSLWKVGCCSCGRPDDVGNRDQDLDDVDTSIRRAVSDGAPLIAAPLQPQEAHLGGSGAGSSGQRPGQARRSASPQRHRPSVESRPSAAEASSGPPDASQPHDRRGTGDLGHGEPGPSITVPDSGEVITGETVLEDPGRVRVTFNNAEPEAVEDARAVDRFKSVAMIAQGLTKLQVAAAKAAEKEAPSQRELDRGVRIERVYEFYDVSTKKTSLKAMDATVIHDRLEGQLVLSGCSSRSSSNTSTASKSSSSSSGSETKQKLQPVRASSACSSGVSMANHELLAMWSVITAKVMRSLVLDFTTISDKAMSRKRMLFPNEPGGHTRLCLASVSRIADVVVHQAWQVLKSVGAESSDVLDKKWGEADLLTKVFSSSSVDTLMLVTNAAGKLLASQPTVVRAKAPCKVFGDIHGQFRDLLLLFHAFGKPEQKNDVHYVFNGDFVDRGEHSLLVIGLLLALKVSMPDKVWLVRGNHEDKFMNEKYGFKDECFTLLGPWGLMIYNLIEKAFNQLPLACVISERVLTVHGGIGDGKWTIDDLSKVKRPLREDQLNHPDNAWIFNILWSDPISDQASAYMEKKAGIFGVHPSPRGQKAAQFGWNVTKTFCAANGLSLIIRSHQCKLDGSGFEVMHEKMLARVFSARDYEEHGNDGAVLHIAPVPLPVGESGDIAAGPKLSYLSVRPQVVSSKVKRRYEKRRKRKDKAQAPGSPKLESAAPAEGKAASEGNRKDSLRSPEESPTSAGSSRSLRSLKAKAEPGSKSPTKATS